MSYDRDQRLTSGSPSTIEEEPGLSLDTVLELLANRRRRFTLYALTATTDGRTTLEALIEDVATLEAAIANEALTRDRYLETAGDLYHWHGDVLADVGVIEIDDQTGTIKYLHHPLLETWLARIRACELSWDANQ